MDDLALREAAIAAKARNWVESDRVLSARHAFSNPALLAQVWAIPDSAVTQ